jgi:hypothetical protein
MACKTNGIGTKYLYITGTQFSRGFADESQAWKWHSYSTAHGKDP